MVNGAVTLGSATLSVTRSFLPTQGSTFVILDGSSPVTPPLVPDPVIAGGVTFDISYSNDVTLTVTNPGDNFNRADNNDLGPDWTDTIGDFVIQGDQVVGTQSKNLSYFNPQPATTDVGVSQPPSTSRRPPGTIRPSPASLLATTAWGTRPTTWRPCQQERRLHRADLPQT